MSFEEPSANRRLLRLRERLSLIPALTGRTASAISVVNFGLTETCNFHCVFCPRWHLPPKETISFERYLRIVNELAPHVEPGCKLRLAGGEVLALPWLPELAHRASSLGFCVEICTNGWYIDARMAELLGDARVSTVALSLDAPDAATHDKLRGKPGSFDRVMAAFGHLQRHAPKVQSLIMTLAIRQNIDKLDALIDLAQSTPAIGGVFVQVLYSNYGTDWDRRREDERLKNLVPDPGTAERAFLKLLERKRQGAAIVNDIAQLQAFIAYYERPFELKRQGPCPVLADSIIIDEGGEMRLCPHDEAVGNVLATPIPALLNSPKTAAMRRKMSTCTCLCYTVLNCSFRDELQFQEG